MSGYLYGNLLLSGFVSFPTGMTFIICGAIFFVQSDRSKKPLSFLLNSGTASKIIINMLPLIIAMPPVFGIIFQISRQYNVNQSYLSAAALSSAILLSIYAAFKSARGLGAKIDRLMREKETARTELLFSEKKYRTLVESLQEGIILLDEKLKIVYANPCILSMFCGTVENELTGKLFTDFLDSQSREAEDKLRSHLRHGIICSDNFILRGMLANQIIASITFVPLFDNTSNTNGVLLGIIDITDKHHNEEKLKKTIEDKNILLKELYHRTKNNMQIICSMLRLHTKGIQDLAFVKLLKELENRILAMSLVHQKLYESEDLSRINAKSYIKDLFRFIICPELSRPDIHIDISHEATLEIETAVPVGLILTELIINTQKHAFNENSPDPKIDFIVLTDDANMICEYRDNGSGLPVNFSIKTNGQLGLKMAENITENQLGGKFEITSQTNKGFSCRFSFGI